MFLLMISLAVCGQIVSYVDSEGTTHYVDSPSQIPAKYRKKAKALEGELSTVAPGKLTKEEEAARAKKALAQESGAGPNAVSAARRVGDAAKKPEEPVLTTQQKERQRYDTAVNDLKLDCSGPRRCVVRPTSNKPALKPGESCHASGAACTVPPECCSNRCNSNTFICE
jgi:hypothetical protein